MTFHLHGPHQVQFPIHKRSQEILNLSAIHVRLPPAAGRAPVAVVGARGSAAHVALTASRDDNGEVVRYTGEVPLDRPGSFGYTVRVLPKNPLLSSRAELGLVTYPQAPAGMTNGDLR